MGIRYSTPAPSEKLPAAASSLRQLMPARDDAEDEAPPPYSASAPTTTISPSQLRDWEESLLQDPKNRLAITTLATTPYTTLLQSQRTLRTDTQIFNTKIPLEGSPITNQRSSGRCWLFAATNIFRIPLMNRYHLADFELSQAYLFYWDKIEKANYFLEQIVATASLDLSSRLVQTLLQDPVTDGGQWDMLANIVRKYGLVPHALYPDRVNAQASAKMDWLVTAKLREQALRLRRLVRDKQGATAAAVVAREKDAALREIHALITLMLGPPPRPDEEFVWECVDAGSGRARRVVDTPRGFAEKAFAMAATRRGEVDPTSMISLVNDPRNGFGRLMTVDRLGNVVEGQPITYVNVDMKTIKTAAISMLRAGYPVFFGCDVGKFSDSALGVMDAELWDLELGFNVTLGMSKAERLSSGETAMTHAMVLTAVHVEEGKPVRWRVQNSWGDQVGDKGWFVMTDRWMDEFTFQVVVDPRFVSKEVRDILSQEPTVLPRWDPMGVLA
ncbi:peptidase C1B, bleomycin hydrolase [Aspergillus ambiguus]|uniref:C1 family peptidase n=1 Tax=Aspergillus ambiguus TaxID=176160 RepID=UPI003CCDAEC2